MAVRMVLCSVQLRHCTPCILALQSGVVRRKGRFTRLYLVSVDMNWWRGSQKRTT